MSRPSTRRTAPRSPPISTSSTSVAPPDQGVISFVELLRDYRRGRVGMIVEVGMEYAHLLRDDPALAEKSGRRHDPGRPAGRRPNLYAPPWSIPTFLILRCSIALAIEPRRTHDAYPRCSANRGHESAFVRNYLFTFG